VTCDEYFLVTFGRFGVKCHNTTTKLKCSSLSKREQVSGGLSEDLRQQPCTLRTVFAESAEPKRLVTKEWPPGYRIWTGSTISLHMILHGSSHSLLSKGAVSPVVKVTVPCFLRGCKYSVIRRFAHFMNTGVNRTMSAGVIRIHPSFTCLRPRQAASGRHDQSC
jgi:hypothetical protein